MSSYVSTATSFFPPWLCIVTLSDHNEKNQSSVSIVTWDINKRNKFLYWHWGWHKKIQDISFVLDMGCDELQTDRMELGAPRMRKEWYRQMSDPYRGEGDRTRCSGMGPRTSWPRSKQSKTKYSVYHSVLALLGHRRMTQRHSPALLFTFSLTIANRQVVPISHHYSTTREGLICRHFCEYSDVMSRYLQCLIVQLHNMWVPSTKRKQLCLPRTLGRDLHVKLWTLSHWSVHHGAVGRHFERVATIFLQKKEACCPICHLSWTSYHHGCLRLKWVMSCMCCVELRTIENNKSCLYHTKSKLCQMNKVSGLLVYKQSERLRLVCSLKWLPTWVDLVVKFEGQAPCSAPVVACRTYSYVLRHPGQTSPAGNPICLGCLLLCICSKMRFRSQNHDSKNSQKRGFIQQARRQHLCNWNTWHQTWTIEGVSWILYPARWLEAAKKASLMGRSTPDHGGL